MANVPVTPGSGLTIAAEDPGTGALYQAVKIVWGAKDSVSWATSLTPLPTIEPRPLNSTSASVPATVSASTILASNASRRRYSICNDSTATLYVLEGGTGPASLSNYSFKVSPGGYLSTTEWNGAVTGLWDAANGAARVTEYLP